MPLGILEYFNVFFTPSAEEETPPDERRSQRESKRHQNLREDTENLVEPSETRKPVQTRKSTPVRRVLQSVEGLLFVFLVSITMHLELSRGNCLASGRLLHYVPRQQTNPSLLPNAHTITPIRVC